MKNNQENLPHQPSSNLLHNEKNPAAIPNRIKQVFLPLILTGALIPTANRHTEAFSQPRKSRDIATSIETKEKFKSVTFKFITPRGTPAKGHIEIEIPDEVNGRVLGNPNSEQPVGIAYPAKLERQGSFKIKIISDYYHTLEITIDPKSTVLSYKVKLRPKGI